MIPVKKNSAKLGLVSSTSTNSTVAPTPKAERARRERKEGARTVEDQYSRRYRSECVLGHVPAEHVLARDRANANEDRSERPATAHCDCDREAHATESRRHAMMDVGAQPHLKLDLDQQHEPDQLVDPYSIETTDPDGQPARGERHARKRSAARAPRHPH